jgi:hypothetical protein
MYKKPLPVEKKSQPEQPPPKYTTETSKETPLCATMMAAAAE